MPTQTAVKATIEITEGTVKTTAKGKSYVSIKYSGNGQSNKFAAIWETAEWKGIGKYEAEIVEETGKDGKNYTNVTPIKFLSALPTTPSGTPVTSLDSNRFFTEKAMTARCAMLTAKDLAIAIMSTSLNDEFFAFKGGHLNNAADLMDWMSTTAKVLFKEMEALTLGKKPEEKKEPTREPIGV